MNECTEGCSRPLIEMAPTHPLAPCSTVLTARVATIATALPPQGTYT